MSQPETTPAMSAADKIVRIFGQFINMHVNDILPDIQEAVREEREACADLAERIGGCAGDSVACMIRERPAP
jgi:hypothetical protein